MERYQIIIALIGFALVLAADQFIVNQKSFIAKPEAEQRKFKKQFRWGMVIAFVFYFGFQLLINSKTKGWLPWLVISCYLFLWGMGGYLIRHSYRLGIKKEITLLKKSNGQLFNNPHKFIRSIAIVNLLTGLAICLLAIAIPIFKIKLASWAPLILVISSFKQIVFSRFEKTDAT